jgi:hypothetical protein
MSADFLQCQDEDETPRRRDRAPRQVSNGRCLPPFSILLSPSARFIPALCLCLAALAGSFAAPAHAQAAPAAGGGDLLQFLNGAVLHGTLKEVDAAHGLRWEHPDAATPFDLMPGHVDFVRFPQAKSLALTPSCHIRFASGDDLFGSLVSLDGDSLAFNAWFGGSLKIPRTAIQTITFLPKNYSIVYEGPEDASDWVVTGLRQTANGGSVRIINGQRFIVNGAQGIIMMNGAQVMQQEDAARGGASGPTNWTYRDGSFATAGAGLLGRNFNLTGSSTIEFDLSCNGSFSLLLSLYSMALDRVEMNNNSFRFEIDNGQITLFANGGADMSNMGIWGAFNPSSRAVTITNFDAHSKPARFTFQCNKDEGSLAVLVDGVLVKRWTDLGGFDDLGTGFVVDNQAAGSTVKLSRFKITRWGGKYEPDIAPVRATNTDMVSFINHDKAGVKVQGITGGNLDVGMGGNILRIPCERVRQIDFAQSSAEAEPRGPWEVRAVFPGGGSVSFQLERWDDKSITGHSALFGSLAFQPGSIREMVFNLDKLRTEPATPLENEFDALDQ